MKILGYSERGIINSLIFAIGDDKKLMAEFIELIKIPNLKTLENPISTDYTILLEQSFSRFGDADLVIIIHYEKPEDDKVLFIEGKVKTSGKSWNIQTQYKNHIEPKNDKKKIKPKNYWSNLFSQLYLKKLLIENWDNIKNDDKFEIETDFLGKRKIGNNTVVLKAFELIKCKQAFYVGLIPSTSDEIKDFKKKDETGYNYISWEAVHEFCKEHKLKKVLKIFKYNKGQIF